MRTLGGDRELSYLDHAVITAKRGVIAGGVAFVVILGVLVGRGGEQPSQALVETPAPAPSASPTPEPGCSTSTKPFVPTSVKIDGIEKISILPLKLDEFGIPGTPPLTLSGKDQMAFDTEGGVKVGAKRGNALFNAHTYGDGSALGNRLLEELEKGDQIVVEGPGGRQCYEVTTRKEVAADARDSGYFDNMGRPRMAIVVCSGKRLGPGSWTERTIWFASPVA
ncbi:MAG: class F sortase [Sporichthyaceae bacterium]